MNTSNIEPTHIPSLKIEANGDGTITLEQEWSGNVDRVAVHVVHLRYLAEKLGLIEAPGVVERGDAFKASPLLAEVKRENDRLKRNMLRVREHALYLQNDVRENSDWKHADLTHEMGVINTLVDLLDMAVDDFADDYDGREPTENPRGKQREQASGAQLVGDDGLKNPRKPQHGRAEGAAATPPGQLELGAL